MPRKLSPEKQAALKAKLADPSREVWTVRDVAEYLGMSEDSVRDYAKANKIPGAVQFCSVWRFSSAKVRALFGSGPDQESGKDA
jgi:hypothetical protein